MSLAGMMAATSAMRRIFGAQVSAQAMLDVEAALAVAHAGNGGISQVAADAIIQACDSGRIDLDALAGAGAIAGTIVIPLVAWLRAEVGAHAGAVHRGATSQDIIDTALVLQIQQGLALLDADAAVMACAAARLAAAHGETPMLSRTLMQPALPISFGVKASNWLTMIDDARIAMRGAAGVALKLQYGGAAGTMDGLDFATAGAWGAGLSLPVPALPWHTNRGPLALLGCTIAAAVGALGKIATDVILMMQAEVGELAEPAAPGRGGSSVMAHKRNPTLSIAVRAAALRAPHLAASLLSAMAQEHERAAGAWQAESAIWPELMLVASGAFAALRDVLDGLIVDEAALARNLSFSPVSQPAAASAAVITAALDRHAAIIESLSS